MLRDGLRINLYQYLLESSGNALELPDESEFTALRYFALDGSDYPSHAVQEAAIAGYLGWRNRHWPPKRHFAVDSKIRRPDYLLNVA